MPLMDDQISKKTFLEISIKDPGGGFLVFLADFGGPTFLYN